MNDIYADTRELIGHAALLCKTDLLTQMVGEFPELQGIMGRYYALQNGEPEPVAKAIEEHYHPRFAQDTLPETALGSLLALSDRIDTLVGMFGLGKRPTGDKDPFALRRQALAVLRILIEQEWDLDLNQLLLESKKLYGELLHTEVPIIQPLLEFCFERLRDYYTDQGIPSRTFNAVLAINTTNPLDFDRRIKAVSAFEPSELEKLKSSTSRIKKILAKNENIVPTETVFKVELLIEPAERELFDYITESQMILEFLLKQPITSPSYEHIPSYQLILKLCIYLTPKVEQFFESVMVMSDNVELRNNRLRLLSEVKRLFLTVSDISLL